MFEDDKDCQLEAQLDSLLSTYSAVEPRPGLETRIRACLQARVIQRRQQWMLIFAAAVAAVALIAFVGTRMRPSSVPNYAVAPGPSAETSLAHSETSSPPPPIVTMRLGVARRARVGKSNNNALLLQIANASQGDTAMIFQEEKLYLSPEIPEEREPGMEDAGSSPGINIQSVDVRPVEIKDLAPAKDIDSSTPQPARIVIPLP